MTLAKKKKSDDVYSYLENELKKSIQGEVNFDDVYKQMYSTDGSIYSMTPIGVTLPKNPDDVSAIIDICNRNNTAVLPRGGGTSLSGQTVNSAVVMDFSKYMNNVLEINPEENYVITEPGITIDNLNQRLKHTNLHFTPDPSTKSRANVGGAMGNNSCGAHSVIYGKTVDQVKEMEVILSDSSKAYFEEISGKVLEDKISLSNLEGKIYRDVMSLSSKYYDEISNKYSKVNRRVGGYNLDLVHPNSNKINLVNIMVGSEGTLAAVTKAKLNLEPIPKFVGLAILHFKDLVESMEATVATLDEGPAAVEHIGEMIITQAKQSLGFSRNLDFLQGDPTDILVVEMNGNSQSEVKSKIEKLSQKMNRLNLSYAITKLYEPSKIAQVWAMRQAGLGLMMNIPGDKKPIPFVEDTAVSPEKLPEYVKRFDEIVRNNGTEAGYYGHASEGCLHIRPTINLKNQEGIDRMIKISDEISDLVKEFDGSLSGEHGDGIVRGVWSEKMYGPKIIDSFRDLKQAFDPETIMNPGKIFDTPKMGDNLRYGTAYKLKTIDTVLDFTQEGGFEGAIEKCIGVGACRKLNAGAMCPSYMATREEVHSTRGRANALRGVLSGALKEDLLTSKKMLKVLDLCIECKSCKSECPANVDMAKIKYEFLHNYYKKNKTPLRSKLVGSVPKLYKLIAGPQAHIFNFFNKLPITKIFNEKFIGIHKNRELPNISSYTFESWFRKRKANTSKSRGKILFFHDTHINFIHPEVGKSAVKILEAAGYEVEIADRKCCGRTMISKGLLDEAKKNVDFNTDLLYKYVEQGIKIVGVEASCMSSMQDEFPDLATDKSKAKQISENTFTVQDLLMQIQDDGKQQISWNATAKNLLLFVHCHERALDGTSNSLGSLNLPNEFNANLIDAGCCGMAGSFGMEKEHYDISKKMAEDRLLPAINNSSKEEEIIVTGISCHDQIGDLSNKKPKYLVEVLAEAIDS
ncbi:MAG: FAD-linked oxidase C-terminal domain-containing protein [Chloroflexota bacterium]|nr:FAD-linked oxidase C-terminal domain-containing protein [Chloroflexota bacterium]MED5237277.1 FAD-linked oxidase C-terminal domain-containing protein [Chloroflexota bacterium]